MEEINVNEIIKVEQMPKVFSQLEMIGKFIDECVKDIDILPCTEENKNDVKKKRTEINNILKELDDRRKFIKNKILEPYEAFNEKYEQECKGKLLSASEILKTKIDSIEEQQKKEKENELREFANQWFISKGIEDYVKFEDIHLNITLSATEKSLKDQIIAFCERVFKDIQLIELEEYKDEILVEYKKNLDFSKSKLEVITRKKQLEEIQKRQQELEKQHEEEQKMVEKVEEIIKTPEEIIEVQFKIKTTKTKAKKVKEFLINEGIEYE